MQCSVPFCSRIANFTLRHCCSECKRSGGRYHRSRCELVFRTANAYRSRSRSNSPRRQHEGHRSRSRSRSTKGQDGKHCEARNYSVVSAELDHSVSVPTLTSTEAKAGHRTSDEIPWCTICHESITFTNGRAVITHCEHLYCYECWRHYVQMKEAKAARPAAIELRCVFCRCKVDGKFKIFG